MAERKKKSTEVSKISGDFARIQSLRHSDPHSYLGMHGEKGGTRFRVYRPDALSASILLSPKKEILLEKIGESGLFEGFLEGSKELAPYQVQVRYAGGEAFTFYDPYAFWPTLGEMDLYLLGEGNHEKLYEKLGAHFRLWQAVKGVSFSVWAPSAASVSVVGDFNSWDGRLHSMRRLGNSGIWEIFIPELPRAPNTSLKSVPREATVF